jgi:lysyl-tRNA synthetase class II
VTIHILKRRSGEIQAVTDNDDVAKAWLETVNKDWELSGDIGPSNVVEEWPVSRTVEEALHAKEFRQAGMEAQRYMDQFHRLSPEAQAFVRQRYVD